MSTRSGPRWSLAGKIGLTSWLIILALIVIPFAVIGESWGMVWMYAAAPLSFVVEEKIGIGDDSYALIAFVSAGSAALWALVVFAVACAAFRRRPIQSLDPTRVSRPAIGNVSED